MTRSRWGLGEVDTGWESPERTIPRLATAITALAKAGAEVVVFPELATSGFTMRSGRYGVPLRSPSLLPLAVAARESGVTALVGVPVQQGRGVVNGMVRFPPRGPAILAYAKRTLFYLAGEHRHYQSGIRTRGVMLAGLEVAIRICFELRFPELFIGRSRPDAYLIPANWPAARRDHWLALLRARAIESQAFVLGVNRRGQGGGIRYSGDSVAFDPWGEELPLRRVAGAGFVVTLDHARIAQVRRQLPLRPPGAR